MKQLNKSPNNELSDYCHYFRAHSFQKKKLFKKALSEIKLVSKKFLFQNLVYNKLGGIYLELNELEKSVRCFKEAERTSTSNTQELKISDVYQNLALAYLHLNQFKKSKEYFFKSLSLQEKDTASLSISYMNIANLYYAQYKDKQAIPYFEKAYSLSKKVKDFEIKFNTTLNMAVVEENRSHFKQALIYRKESEHWKDSLNNQNKVWAVADFEKKFAVAQNKSKSKYLK